MLELWAVIVTACVIGFLGPFGTYSEGSFVDRVEKWGLLLMGAYVLVRPCIFGLRWFARSVSLPERTVVIWGVIFLSAPIAVIWRLIRRAEFGVVEDHSALLPFAIICAISVMRAELWGRSVGGISDMQPPPMRDEQPDVQRQPILAPVAANPSPRPPRLFARLSPNFQGPILALQSEDHYVHVYGPAGKELLLMRLREAIAEMGGEPGDQVHRSWWIARSGIARVEKSGRNLTIHLVNGQTAPVSRDAVYRLQQSGFLMFDAAAPQRGGKSVMHDGVVTAHSAG
jgi:hypothetical protein